MKRTFIFILTHGLWGQELIKSTEMVIGGQINDIKAFSLMPDMSLKDYEESISKTMADLSGYSFLFLVDILGGTPYNIAACYTQEYGAEALSGLSMDLLIAVLDLREQYPCTILPELLISRFQDRDGHVADLKKLLLDSD